MIKLLYFWNYALSYFFYLYLQVSYFRIIKFQLKRDTRIANSFSEVFFTLIIKLALALFRLNKYFKCKTYRIH